MPWLSGVAENQMLTVVWGDSQHCSLHLPEHMEDTANRLIFTLSLIKEMKMTFMKGLPLLLLVASLCSHAALQPDRTRIVFNANDKATSLRVDNRSDKLPYLAYSLARK